MVFHKMMTTASFHANFNAGELLVLKAFGQHAISNLFGLVPTQNIYLYHCKKKKKTDKEKSFKRCDS